MSSTLKILGSTQIAVATTETTVYTVPTGKAVKFQTISLHNPTNVGVLVSMSVVPSGGASDTTRRVLSRYTLNAYDTISQDDVLAFLKNVVAEAGTLLTLNCDTAAALNVLVTGVEIG